MTKIREVPETILSYIKKEMEENVEFGTITIKLRGKDKSIDIESANQKRFDT